LAKILFSPKSPWQNTSPFAKGDDYWTDPYKLQKQVDFLEENEEYGVVHGDSHFYIQTTQKWQYNANKFLSNAYEIKDKRELFNRLVNADYKIRTATVLFRKILLDKRKPNEKEFLMGDTPMWLDFSQITKFKYIDEVFCSLPYCSQFSIKVNQ